MNIPGYEIQSKLGQGGMAVVYLAVQESLHRPVALKVLNPLLSDDPEFSERFLREGRILASLTHANIITIHDIGITEHFHYISMELVDGADLKTRMLEGLSEDTAFDYIETIAACLSSAHKEGVVHRDVKPANILFRRDGTLLLTDFGIAKRLDGTSELTATGTPMGSPHYLSPEQAQGQPVDERTDVYSTGIILYEMLVGEKPYKGGSDIDTIVKQLRDPLPVLPEHLAEYQPLLNTMIAKAPADRFRSMEEVQHHIAELRASSPPSKHTATVAASVDQEAHTLVTAVAARPREDSGKGKFHRDRWLALAGVVALSSVVAWVLSPTGQAPPSAPAETALSGSETPAPEATMPGTGEATQPATSSGIRPAESEPLRALPHAPPEESEATLDDHSVAGADELQFRDEHEQHENAVHEMLEFAQRALTEDRLTTPANDNANAYYRIVLQLDPENAPATQGLAHIANRYGVLAKRAAAKGDPAKARRFIGRGLAVVPEQAELLALDQQLQKEQARAKTTVASDAPEVNEGDSQESQEIIGEPPSRLFERAKDLFERR